MKQLFLLILICNSTFLYAQPCLSSTSAAELRVNKVKATIRGAGSLWDPEGLNTNESYVAPYPNHTNGQIVNAMYSGSVWIGGKDPSGNFKVAGQTFAHFSDNWDYWPGPIVNDTITSLECLKWDRHWEVFGSEIDTFKADLMDGTINDPIPQNILEWPGRGNPNTFGVLGPLPLIDLAPFHDSNGDNIYNANDGDYPILGLDNIEYADQMIWWVFNDIGDGHNTGGPAIGVEVHGLAYAFVTPLLEYTSFYKHTFINKGTTDLQETNIGLWTDPQIGCWNNDFIGCDTIRSMAIAYNGEQLDSMCPNPQYTEYGVEVPYLGIDILRGPLAGDGCRPLTSFMTYYSNGGSPQGRPIGDEEYYNMMSGKWRSGDPIEYGGDGFQENTFPYPFMYPDNPSSGTGWSECSENDFPRDTRMILGTGSFSFPVGGKNEFTIAVIFEPDVPHPCPDFQRIQTTSDQIQALYDSWSGGACLPPTSNEDLIVPEALRAVSLYPNPAYGNASIILEKVPNNAQIDLYSITGQLLTTIKQPTETGGTVVWQQKNDALSSGLYLVKVELADKGSKVLKLTISK